MTGVIVVLCVLLAAAIVTIFSLFVMYERRFDRLVAATQTEHPDMSMLIDLVDRLCQRVQAPQAAIIEHSAGVMPGYAPASVSTESDEDYWRAQLSKEELAERMMAAELDGS